MLEMEVLWPLDFFVNRSMEAWKSLLPISVCIFQRQSKLEKRWATEETVIIGVIGASGISSVSSHGWSLFP